MEAPQPEAVLQVVEMEGTETPPMQEIVSTEGAEVSTSESTEVEVATSTESATMETESVTETIVETTTETTTLETSESVTTESIETEVTTETESVASESTSETETLETTETEIETEIEIEASPPPEEELIEPTPLPGIPKVYRYEDDTLFVEVFLPEGAEVPDDASLSVRTIIETDEDYEALAIQASESVEGNAEEIILYDVSFFTADREYIPVADTATVIFTFKESLIVQNDAELAVLHFEEGTEVPKQLATVSVEVTAAEQVTQVSFETEGFSVFAVVSVTSSSVRNLSGDYAIVYRSGTNAYALSSTSSGSTLVGQPVTVNADNSVQGDNITLWTITKASSWSNTYYIRNANGRYLNLSSGSASTSNSAQAFTIENASGQVRIYRTSGRNKIGLNLSGTNFTGATYSSSSDTQKLYLYEEVETPSLTLNYNLNINGNYVGDDRHEVISSASAWGGQIPSLDATTQSIEETATTLYAVQGVRDGQIFNNTAYIHSGAADITQSDISHINKFLKQQGDSYGKEFRFEGWSATIDGVEYLFAEGTTAVAKDGYIAITDTTGVERLLPTGTTLKGEWTEVSDVALFFVNYSGTILDTEGDVSGRNQSEFTPCVGIARIYHGTETFGSDGNFAAEANHKIQASFVNEYDPSNPGTQIVMLYVSTSTGVDNYEFDEVAPGINPTELADYVLRYIKNKEEVIKISTNNNTHNPPIDPNNADSNHYQIRWYVMKEQTDAWHIDGVLVAKTSEMEVVKNFSGLQDSEVSAIVGTAYNDFQIDLNLGDSPYFTISCDPNGIPGQYTYNGRISSDAQSYGWTFQAILNELYTMTERNYTVNGYNCSTVVTVRTNDGVSHRAYGTSTSDVTTIGPYLQGGVAESITFDNFYTKDDTGTLAIVKQDASLPADDKANKLKGATFELENYSTGSKVTAVTDDNGSVVFSNLEPDYYYLRETSPPDGYIKSNREWIVNVTESLNGYVTVTVIDEDGNETVCYQAQEVTYIYPIQNTPSDHTVTVVKEFSEISDAALTELKNNTTNPYTITLQDKNGTTQYNLTLNDAEVVQNNKTFTWRIVGVDAGYFTVTEKNYYHSGYKDVKVESSTGPVRLDYENQTAEFDATFSASASDYLTIKNTYLNQYGLTIRKIDKDTDALLAGAEFEIYGPYQESINTSNKITYEDSGGQIQTAYYIDSLTIGEGGIGTIPNLTLSSATEKVTYVLKEITAPEGYEPPEKPIVIENVGPGREINLVGATMIGEYKNGILQINVPNTLKSDVTVQVEASKVWDGSVTGSEVTFELYRMIEGGTPLLVNGQTKTISASDNWKCTWTDLPMYDASSNPYIYCIREGPVNGFTASYSNGEVTVTADGQRSVAGTTILNPVTGIYELTVTNHSTYVLPQTGGMGTSIFTIGGLIIIALSLLYGYTLHQKRRIKE